MQKVQRDVRNLKRVQESLTQQNEDKENTIFKLRKDLRSMKEQLNEEKIRHRRSKVMQSRIPAPTRGTRRAITQNNGPKSSGLTSRVNNMNIAASKSDGSLSPSETVEDGEKTSPNSVARIRFRVLKMLQQHDPTKVAKIDEVMAKYEGRETQLLEKMITRYEGGKEGSSSFIGTVEATTASLPSSSDGSSRPISRQDEALQRHMKRMQRIRASSGKSSSNKG